MRTIANSERAKRRGILHGMTNGEIAGGAIILTFIANCGLALIYFSL